MEVLATEEQLKVISGETLKQMVTHIGPFVTPISGERTDWPGLVGTGGYVSVAGRKLLLTNAHVACERSKHSLCHQFFGSDTVHRITDPFTMIGPPYDLASCPIRDAVWTLPGHSGSSVPMEQFSKAHEPALRELLFLVGYSGSRSDYSAKYNRLKMPGTPYLMQEVPTDRTDPENPDAVQGTQWDDRIHFALLYPKTGAWSPDTNFQGLPNPHGFSGSMVWNTRRVQFLMEGREWTPAVAQLTGLVWGWDEKKERLLATRVEHVRRFIEFAQSSDFRVQDRT